MPQLLNATTSPKIPGSAAHAAFRVHDMQALIFPHLLALDTNGQPLKEQNDLVNLAVTCQAFLEVALDVLWRHVNFGRLIQVWKARGVVIERNSNYPEEMKFERAPTVEDWQRFEYYARRVHHMRLDSLPAKTRFSNDFATAVLERSMHPRFQIHQSPPLPLFYKMNSLELESADAESEVCAYVAVINESPGLQSVAVVESPWPVGLSDVCHVILLSLGRSGTPLKSLVVQLESELPSGLINIYTHSLVKLIIRSKLEELVLHSTAITLGIVLNVISGLPTLKTLGLSSHFRFPDDYRAPVPQNGFSSLECLTGDILAVRSLLTLPKFPRLTRLVALHPTHRPWFTWPPVREMVRAIGESCPALEVLHLTGMFVLEDPPTPSSEWPATSVFAHLQACPRLKDVRFNFSGSPFECSGLMARELDLSDEQWEQLALAWPDLISIWLRAAWITPFEDCILVCPRPRATLRTIASFFGHCSQLSSFGIPVSARGEDAKAALKEVSPKQDPVNLDFQVSWIKKEDSQDIAMFLAALAPHSKTHIQIPTHLSLSQYNGSGGSDAWPEERAMELARRGDWQGIEQLVESARNAGQPWLS